MISPNVVNHATVGNVFMLGAGGVFVVAFSGMFPLTSPLRSRGIIGKSAAPPALPTIFCLFNRNLLEILFFRARILRTGFFFVL
jgi:hypothetical protein